MHTNEDDPAIITVPVEPEDDSLDLSEDIIFSSGDEIVNIEPGLLDRTIPLLWLETAVTSEDVTVDNDIILSSVTRANVNISSEESLAVNGQLDDNPRPSKKRKIFHLYD